jgi:hypothetical protein
MVTNRWSPDTCDCVIEYEFDADLDESSRTHTGNKVVKDCPEHSGLGTPSSFFNAILDENQRKNITRQDLLENVGDLAESLPDGGLDFKNGISFSFSWTGSDADRVLHIQISGYTLTAPQRTTVQTILDGRFGAGKVVID